MSNVIQFPTKSILTELHDDFIHCFNVIDSQLSQFHDDIDYKYTGVLNKIEGGTP